MKLKMIFFCTTVLLGASVFGQTRHENISFGFTGGINWNTVNGKNAIGDKLENDLKTGFHAGLNVEIPLKNGFYLQPGLEYRQKGAEMDNGNKLTLSYIDIPVYFLYKASLRNGRVLLGFGPYVGFGMNGEVKSKDDSERKVSFSNTYSVTEAEDLQFRKLDAGANFMAGYEFRNKISVVFKTQLGLVDINRETEIPGDKTSYRNTGFGFSLGYRL